MRGTACPVPASRVAGMAIARDWSDVLRTLLAVALAFLFGSSPAGQPLCESGHGRPAPLTRFGRDAGGCIRDEPCSRVVDRVEMRLFCRSMRHAFRPRSRVFRSLLALALLAWTALAFNAFAQPFGMLESDATQTAMAAGTAAGAHCNGMAMGHASHGSHAAPSYPTGDGHGCCRNGHCYCASLCNGIAGVPWLDMAWASPHAPMPLPVPVASALAQTAPPLRPPIA